MKADNPDPDKPLRSLEKAFFEKVGFMYSNARLVLGKTRKKPSKKLILVTDPEERTLQDVRVSLSRTPGVYEVINASNSEEAYDMACSFVPDLIIADVRMPVKNGIDLVQSLKRNWVTRNIPVVVATNIACAAFWASTFFLSK